MRQKQVTGQLENQLQKALDRLSGTAVDTTVELPDFSTFTTEKLGSHFLLSILNDIGRNLSGLVKRVGIQNALELIESVINGTPTEEATAIIETNKKNIRMKDEHGNDVVYDASLWDDVGNKWADFLLLLGLPPFYADILSKYFGDDGIISFAVLLKSLLEGHLDISSLLYQLGDQDVAREIV